MPKMYKRKSGLIVLSGPVLAIESSPQGTKVTIKIEEFDSEAKTWNEKFIDATSPAVDEDVAIGCIATAVGYQCGQTSIAASVITTGANVICPEPDVEVVTGMVQKASLKTEVNDDGTPKLKRDGTPRKPHFDVSVVVPNSEGRRVIHIVKIYNFKEVKNGGKTEIEKAQKAFENFQDKDATPMAITIVTQPGLESTWESEYNCNVYQNYASSHLGKMSWDIFPITEVSVVEQQQSVQTPPVAPAPQVAPQPQVQTPQPTAPVAPVAPVAQQPYVAPQPTYVPQQQYQQPVAQQIPVAPQCQPQPQPQKMYGSPNPIQIEDDDPVTFS